MDKILLNNLRFFGILGVNPDERINPQRILVSLVVFTDIHRPGLTDDISDAVNYAELADKLKEFVETSYFFTVEALSTNIADLVLAQPGVSGVRVRVEKPDAISFAGSVGVEINRWQGSLLQAPLSDEIEC